MRNALSNFVSITIKMSWRILNQYFLFFSFTSLWLQSALNFCKFSHKFLAIEINFSYWIFFSLEFYTIVFVKFQVLSYYYYTDGSKLDGGTGAGVFCRELGLELHFRLSDEWDFRNLESPTSYSEFYMNFVDSQAALRANVPVWCK